MANILMINFPAEGHVNPTVGVAKAFVDRGDSVYYITTENFRERLENVGVHVRVHPNVLEAKKNYITNFHEFLKIHMRISLYILEIVRELSQDVTFDVVYYDTFGAGKLVRDYLGIPGISSSSTFVFPNDFFEKSSLHGQSEWNVSPDEEMKGLLYQMQEIFGVSPENELQFMRNDGELNIVYTSRYFQPNSDIYDEKEYVFVGPVLVERQQNQDFPLLQLKNEKVLYISLGTVLQNMEEFFNICIEAFADFDGKVVIAVGKEIDFNKLSPAPDQFIIRSYVPQLEILQQADVFITHGGMNSVSEAIFYNVPLVVLPHDKDQPTIAQRLEELGAGYSLTLKHVDAHKLKEAVSVVLSKDMYREGIRKINESFQQSGGVEKVIQAIDLFIETKIHQR
ncbi:macrolide family glycosyltransferase [Bacillus gaemokensis]|uniref:UDP-glucosyltransferase n=1 Tax=Bacillus gaemokensis TaxID=574375 RepID=A0A073K6C1_9BACI|nr:macrolide family glycosyltransferase [Bacillus gaemokensis]KEK21967.1 UDP-glucosyltransferase [Bacillus gaemokensis]KYG38456.1 UDP-glucosyltransferase [Bacillus gaemokensis]